MEKYQHKDLQSFNIKNSLTVTGVSESESDKSYNDFVLVLRQNIWLHERVRFYSTMHFGAGDSEFTYGFAPEIQVFINDHFAAGLGYRGNNWDIEGDRSAIEGEMRGATLSVTGSW